MGKLLARLMVVVVALGAFAGALSVTGPANAVEDPNDPTYPVRVPSSMEAPVVVWRFDNRPPGLVFPNGFTIQGGMQNVLAHASGFTFDTNYVATTGNPDRLRDFVTTIATGPTIWLYEIRATQNFYNVTGTLDYLIDMPNPPGIIAEEARDTRELGANAQEWASLGSIPTGQIIRATMLTLSDLDLPENQHRPLRDLTTNPVPNPAYVSDLTTANPYVITNPRFNGLNTPHRSYLWGESCDSTPSFSARSQNGRCQLGSFRLTPLPDPWNGKSFAIRPKLFYNRALDMNRSVTTWPADENAHQIFIPESDSADPSYYRLKNVSTNQYLIHDGSNLSGTVFSNSSRALWRFDRQANGWYRIVSKDSSLVLTRPSTDSTDVFVTFPPKMQRDADEWAIAPIGGIPMPHERIAPHLQPSHVLGAVNGTQPGSSVTLQAPHNNPGFAQRWFYDYNPNRGAYLIGNTASKTAPDRWFALARRSTTNASKVELWDGGYADQSWIIRQNSLGFYEFLNYEMTKSADGMSVTIYTLELPGSDTSLGTVVAAQPYDGGANQQWQPCTMHYFYSTTCTQ
ncbi:RICIN domain-containing protein [Leifsonia sp. McL0607]|uniref:RICIN domain-containing protein n=1 Tax=Leifsonia sp. McL0607 TaxID=3415672 RepID=UPI003CFAF625